MPLLSKEAEESHTAAESSGELLPVYIGECPDILHHSVVCRLFQEDSERSAEGHQDGPKHHWDTAAGS